MADSNIKSTVQRPSTTFLGVHHLKMPSEDVSKTIEFYSTIFPFTPLPQFDHVSRTCEVYASAITHEPSQLLVEVRHDPGQARLQKGWDPIIWLVDSRADLDAWAAWFDSQAVPRSKVFTGITGWVIVCRDPDGRFAKLYTREEHERIDYPDEDPHWLRAVEQ